MTVIRIDLIRYDIIDCISFLLRFRKFPADRRRYPLQDISTRVGQVSLDVCHGVLWPVKHNSHLVLVVEVCSETLALEATMRYLQLSSFALIN